MTEPYSLYKAIRWHQTTTRLSTPAIRGRSGELARDLEESAQALLDAHVRR